MQCCAKLEGQAEVRGSNLGSKAKPWPVVQHASMVRSYWRSRWQRRYSAHQALPVSDSAKAFATPANKTTMAIAFTRRSTSGRKAGLLAAILDQSGSRAVRSDIGIRAWRRVWVGSFRWK